jgi:Right handed beta helix region
MKTQVMRLLMAGCVALVASTFAASKTNQPLASTYYVATNGNDTFSGTLPTPNPSGTDGPFLTLQRAQQAVQAAKGHVAGPLTIEIRGGIYYLTAPLSFTSADSGNAAQPITWEGFPGDPEPLISGGQRLTGWTSTSGGIWTLQLPSAFQNFEALYVNGQRLFRPTTTSTYLTLNPVVLSAPAPNCTEAYGNGYRCGDRFAFTPGTLPGTFHDITDVEIIDFEDWTVSRMRLESINGSQSVAYLTGLMATGEFFGFLSGHRYLIQNVGESFGKPGQWYLDRATTPWILKLKARTAAENPNNAVIIAPQQPQLLVAHNLQYITFQNLAFGHDNFTIPPQGHPGYSGEVTTPAALSFNQCSNVTLSGVTIAHTQGWAVEFLGTAVAGEGNTITNSELYDLGTGGIRLGQLPGSGSGNSSVAQYNTVTNTMVTGGGRFLPGGEGTGIWIGSSHHNTISQNQVSDFYNGAIELGQSPDGSLTYTHDNVIAYNLLYNLGQGVTSDMGCVHVASSNNIGNQVLNNVCHDVTNDPAGYGGNGIYLDSNSQNVEVQNNLVYRVSDTALFVNTGGLGHTISNNIFAFAGQGMMRRGPASPGGSFTATGNIFLYDIAPIQRIPADWTCQGNCTAAFDLDHNVYWNTGGTAATFVTTVNGVPSKVAGQYTLAQWSSQFVEDVHSQNVNPVFANSAYPNDDYALTANSPALAMGFQPFDTSLAGPQVPLAPVTPAPVAFPQQLLNPATQF